MKQELKREVEKQKDINQTLKKRLVQYTKENDSLQVYLEGPAGPFGFSASLGISAGMSKRGSSPPQRETKDDLSSQYIALVKGMK